MFCDSEACGLASIERLSKTCWATYRPPILTLIFSAYLLLIEKTKSDQSITNFKLFLGIRWMYNWFYTQRYKTNILVYNDPLPVSARRCFNGVITEHPWRRRPNKRYINVKTTSCAYWLKLDLNYLRSKPVRHP